MTDRLVDAAAVADRLGVPVSWVRETTRAGALPHVRLGRYVRYQLADVDEWLQSCKQPGRPVQFRSASPRVSGS
jgi:excisionase family DNA binding protein